MTTKVEDEVTVTEDSELDIETNLDETPESDSDVEDSSEEEANKDKEDSSEEVVVSIEGETPPQEEDKEAPKWVKDLRKSHRDTQKENRELKAEIETLNGPEKKASSLRVKPKLEEHDYDSEKYENDLDNWYTEKRKYDDEQTTVANGKKQEAEAWQKQLDSYSEKKKALKVKDYEDAEHAVLGSLSVTQQGIALQGAQDPALLFYAIYKANKLKALSEIKDPVQFAFAVAKLETKLKVTNRKASTEPEHSVSSKSGVNVSSDTQLEKLRKEAERTGNYTKISVYKRKLKDKRK